jgi:outer membrane lipoprotein-sorting protein
MNSLPEKLLFALLTGILLLTPSPILAETPKKKGLSIAIETARQHKGFGDYTVDITMILKNKQGRESRRDIRYSALEVIGEGNRSLSIFDSPQDVKGTVLLTISHKAGDDEQWLYLPALKRVKRIHSHSKSGSFMGSEFAYEDISSLEVTKYTYKYLREEQYQGRPCYVEESYPLDKKNSGYTKRVSWVDREEYRLFKVEFYDRKQSLLKTLTLDDYREYPNKQWRAGRMEMVNHQTGKSTTLLWKNYRFRTGLTEKNFKPASLKLTQKE